MRLDGRIAMVTGAGSGMGRAVAGRLASEGAHVIVADLRPEAVAGTVEEITAAGGSAQPEPLDATDVTALRELFARVDREHGVLHILHAHVGMPGPSGLDITEQDWQTNIDVNMKSAFFGCAAAMGLLEKAGGHGSIILTASTSALVGSPFSPLYSMTKGSLTAFARSLALLGAPVGVRANVICPGMVDTPMLPQFFGREAGTDATELTAKFRQESIPLGRAAAPSEIAAVVAFLASDDASYVTGVTLPVDGGVTAK